ncbi:Fuz [Phodopus roborovskii]|uniref:Fuz protein n=1 Tax=Phodopus roborovskii TaxID=109678 RepID=A0AAV0ADI8_PHORO|nr:Fuz [Phodopus roborovskii]
MGDEGPGSTVHLLCLAASSGVPLFCRSSGGGAPSRQQLPFSVVGSLNGVHMFGQNLDVQLNSARTEDTTVVWKSFHDRSLGGSEGTRDQTCSVAPVLDDPRVLACGLLDKLLTLSDP